MSDKIHLRIKCRNVFIGHEFFVFAVSVHLWWTAFILAGLSFLISDKTREER